MNNPEDNIQDFFSEMRKKDDQTPIPEFDELIKKRPRRRKMFFTSLAVAASLLIAVIFYFDVDEKTNIPENELVIIFSDENEINTQSLISIEPSMNSWKSPSDFLIDDFNEW
jgi:hypothetical protein